jgi:hypothetical protein
VPALAAYLESSKDFSVFEAENVGFDVEGTIRWRSRCGAGAKPFPISGITSRRLCCGGIAGQFDAVACGDDVAHGKPHRDLVALTRHRAGACAPDAIMVGDTSFDMIAAVALGSSSLGLLNGALLWLNFAPPVRGIVARMHRRCFRCRKPPGTALDKEKPST